MKITFYTMVLDADVEPKDVDIAGYDGPGWYVCTWLNLECHGPFGTKQQAEEAGRVLYPLE